MRSGRHDSITPRRRYEDEREERGRDHHRKRRKESPQRREHNYRRSDYESSREERGSRKELSPASAAGDNPQKHSPKREPTKENSLGNGKNDEEMREWEEEQTKIDRLWYDNEGVWDETSNPFAGTETYALKKEETLKRRQNPKTTLRHLQYQKDNDIWEKNRMLTSGVVQKTG
eukprot:Sdes_comp23837_c0_seq1m21980